MESREKWPQSDNILIIYKKKYLLLSSFSYHLKRSSNTYGHSAKEKLIKYKSISQIKTLHI